MPEALIDIVAAPVHPRRRGGRPCLSRRWSRTSDPPPTSIPPSPIDPEPLAEHAPSARHQGHRNDEEPTSHQRPRRESHAPATGTTARRHPAPPGLRLQEYPGALDDSIRRCRRREAAQVLITHPATDTQLVLSGVTKHYDGRIVLNEARREGRRDRRQRLRQTVAANGIEVDRVGDVVRSPPTSCTATHSHRSSAEPWLFGGEAFDRFPLFACDPSPAIAAWDGFAHGVDRNTGAAGDQAGQLVHIGVGGVEGPVDGLRPWRAPPLPSGHGCGTFCWRCATRRCGRLTVQSKWT